MNTRFRAPKFEIQTCIFLCMVCKQHAKKNQSHVASIQQCKKKLFSYAVHFRIQWQLRLLGALHGVPQTVILWGVAACELSGWCVCCDAEQMSSLWACDKSDMWVSSLSLMLLLVSGRDCVFVVMLRMSQACGLLVWLNQTCELIWSYVDQVYLMKPRASELDWHNEHNVALNPWYLLCVRLSHWYSICIFQLCGFKCWVDNR